VSTDSVPTIVRDVFELFLETHNSRQFLKKNNLVSDLQRRVVQKTLLKCCAFSGPDGESGPADQTKVSSKFLDLGKVTDDEYVLEGIQISCKWFCEVLAKSP